MPRGGLRLAVTLLTAIPLRDQPGDVPARRAAAAMSWAPVIGLLLGGAAAGVLWITGHYAHAGPLLAAVLAVAVLALLTRGLHLADAALAIMKRSDIGPFGVVTVVLTLLIQVAALAQAQALGRGVPAVIAAAVAGRLALTWACRRGVPAARGSRVGALVAGTVHPAVPVTLSVAAVAGAVAYRLIFGVAVVAGLAVAFALTWHAVRRLGGITGDVLGALVEITAAACLLVTAIS